MMQSEEEATLQPLEGGQAVEHEKEVVTEAQADATNADKQLGSGEKAREQATAKQVANEEKIAQTLQDGQRHATAAKEKIAQTLQEEHRRAAVATPAPGLPILLGRTVQGDGPVIVQGIPLSGAPVLVQGHGPMIVQGIPVSAPVQGLPVNTFRSPLHLTPAELQAMVYRRTVLLLAWLDLVTTFLLWGPMGYLAALGPVCGVFGAIRCNLGCTAIYVAFCALKTVFYAAVVASSNAEFMWLLLMSLAVACNFWMLKVVVIFCRAVGSLPPYRRAELPFYPPPSDLSLV